MNNSKEKDLREHLQQSLDELAGNVYNEFQLGEIYAYLECLEIILCNEGVRRDEIMALEKKYGIAQPFDSVGRLDRE